jgi:Tfp pilus assembly protein PilV
MSMRIQVKNEDGFTVIEALVAAIIVVLGALAVFMTFSAAVRNVQRGKEAQVGISVAQREMEKIRSYPFEKIALKTAPTNSAVTSNPNNRVSGSTFNLKRTGAAEYAPMVVSTSGEVLPSSSAFSVGGTSVSVYRYVVWRKDAVFCATSTNAEKESCQTGQNYKRVVIAVLPSQPGNVTHTRPYYELQSDFVNPNP